MKGLGPGLGECAHGAGVGLLGQCVCGFGSAVARTTHRCYKVALLFVLGCCKVVVGFTKSSQGLFICLIRLADEGFERDLPDKLRVGPLRGVCWVSHIVP